MAKKTSKTAKSNELDGKEFFAAIALIEKEKGIPKSYMLEKITQALVSAYKRDHEGITDNVFVEANEITETVHGVKKRSWRRSTTSPRSPWTGRKTSSAQTGCGPH
ncbi:MAG: NusA N-terminal domain-containing protein [Evtepia gabavorous]